MVIVMKTHVLNECGYAEAVHGMRNCYNVSFERAEKQVRKLAHNDGGHNKFLEMMMIWVDVTAPRYWWAQADTYRVGSVKLSESTMNKKEYTVDDFEVDLPMHHIGLINSYIRDGLVLDTKQITPECFLQKRTWMMSYKTFRNIILQRRNHKLPHWIQFIKQVKDQLEYKELLP